MTHIIRKKKCFTLKCKRKTKCFLGSWYITRTDMSLPLAFILFHITGPMVDGNIIFVCLHPPFLDGLIFLYFLHFSHSASGAICSWSWSWIHLHAIFSLRFSFHFFLSPLYPLHFSFYILWIFFRSRNLSRANYVE